VRQQAVTEFHLFDGYSKAGNHAQKKDGESTEKKKKKKAAVAEGAGDE